MFTKKLTEMVRRQTMLIGKGFEAMTPEEREELDKLNAAIVAATEEPKLEKHQTRLTTMDQEEFAKYVGERMDSDQSPVELQLLKRNIAAVRAQKAEGKDVFAVELLVEKEAGDQLADALARIDALEAKLSEKQDHDYAGLLARVDALEAKLSEKTEADGEAAGEEEAPADGEAAGEEGAPAEGEAAGEEEAPAEGEGTEEPTEKGGSIWAGDLAKGLTPVSSDDEYKMLKDAASGKR